MNLNLMIIRHGKTEANILGKYSGSTDDPLAIDYTHELNHTINTLKDFDTPEMFFSSPMTRCLETSSILFPNVSPKIINELREFDFGDFEGKTWADLENNKCFLKFIESGMETAVPNGDDPAEFRARCIKGLKDISKMMIDKGKTKGAIVCHGGVIMTLFSELYTTKKDFYKYHKENGRGYNALYNTDTNRLEIIGNI